MSQHAFQLVLCGQRSIKWPFRPRRRPLQTRIRCSTMEIKVGPGNGTESSIGASDCTQTSGQRCRPGNPGYPVL